MKKRLAFMVFLVFFASAVLVTQYELAKAETVLKALTAWPKNATDNKSLDFFLESVEQQVAKKYPGELKINLIGGPEAVKITDQVQAAQTGMVDIVHTTNAYYVHLLPEADAMKLSDLRPWEERASGAWAYYNELHEKKLGLYFLGRIGTDLPFSLYLNKPIKTADLRGFNIRVSPMYLQLIKGLGGNPVVIPPTEVYTALERNVVDGYCWPTIGIREWGWEKHTKYIVEPSFYSGPHPMVMNLKTWNGLPKKFQDVITEAAMEAERKIVAYYIEEIKKEISLLKQAGLQVIDLPPAEKEKFLKIAYEEGWKDILGKSPVAGAKLKELLTKKK
ncbi:MAG: TRAP transporter substrate-binding protein DctP [Desulfobacterales bacterium]|nr:TRAP transporter substrate-binding protein DctP [Desulfobacterales bacterium]